MAFTLDSTIGGANANAYTTRLEMVDIADGHIDGELFTDLEDAEQEKYISMATFRLDAEKYSSIRVNNIQALEFPRSGIFNSNFNSYSITEIPDGLKRAAFELILFWLKADDRIMEEAELHDANMIDSYQIGPLKYKFRPNAQMDKLPATVMRELEGIGPNVWQGGTSNGRLAL